MPAHNEAGYLEPAVKAVMAALARHDRFEVVIVENGSIDATAEEADRLAGSYRQVRAIHLDRADYGAALRTGFLAATGTVVVNFDVDLVDVEFLDRAVAAMDSRPALAVLVGTKRGPGAEDHRSAGRRLVTAGFSLVLRTAFGLRISDTHGLKALRRAALAPLVEDCHFGLDIFDTELVIRAERAGLEVDEIPVSVTETRPPRTPVTRRIPRTLAGLARLWVVLRRRR